MREDADLLTYLYRERQEVENRLIQYIQNAPKLDEKVVEYLAYLTMKDNDGFPILSYPVHKSWLKMWVRDDLEDILTIGVPGIGKSYWLVVYASAWIGFNPDKFILLSSDSAPVAVRRSKAIKHIVNSPVFSRCFPHVIPRPNAAQTNRDWSVCHIKNKHIGHLHSTMIATGRSNIGSRAHLLIGDDLIDVESARSETLRNKDIIWFQSQFYPRKQQGHSRIIGNAWGAYDLHAVLYNDKSWHTWQCPSLSESNEVYANLRINNIRSRELLHTKGPSIEPELKPVDDLIEIKETRTKRIWLTTYQGLMNASIIVGFKEETFNRVSLPVQSVGKYLFFDTASETGQDNSFTACVIFDILPDYRIVVSGFIRGKFEIQQLTQFIEKVYYSVDNVESIVIEKKSSGIQAIQALAASSSEEIAKKIAPWDPKRVGKDERVEIASIWVENGSVLLPYPDESTDWLLDFEKQIFSETRFLDGRDAFCMGVMYLSLFLSKGYRARRQRN